MMSKLTFVRGLGGVRKADLGGPPLFGARGSRRRLVRAFTDALWLGIFSPILTPEAPIVVSHQAAACGALLVVGHVAGALGRERFSSLTTTTSPPCWSKTENRPEMLVISEMVASMSSGSSGVTGTGIAPSVSALADYTSDPQLNVSVLGLLGTLLRESASNQNFEQQHGGFQMVGPRHVRGWNIHTFCQF